MTFLSNFTQLKTKIPNFTPKLKINLMKLFTLVTSLLFCCAILVAQPKIQLTDFVSGFSRPVDIAHCNDSRLFVVEQRGKIWIVDSNGIKQTTAFLEIDVRVNDSGNEQGLLGLAFHPNYTQNNFFYVYYIQSNGDTKVSRFTRDSLNVNKADPNSEKVILEQDQPFSNHNGGSLKFGPDGYLYIGLGDGGSAGDPQGNGQNKNTFLSKILRIDIDNGDPYAVPLSNPFVNDASFKPETWTWGLRNPWRISFDRMTGDLWIGDVGQNAREEIDFQPAGVGGYNFGWRCYEGTNTYNTTGCQSASTYKTPAAEYNNPSIGCSITGGFIYRGSKYADLFGHYLYADYCSGRIWSVTQKPDGTFNAATQLANLGDFEFSSFGEGKDGELYIALLSSGKIQKIKEICSPFQVTATSSNETCAGDANGSIDLSIFNANGTPSFTWTNGLSGEDQSNLTAGIYSLLVKDGNGCERKDTFEITNQSPFAPQVFSSNTIVCEGESITLQSPVAPTGLGYQWYESGITIPNAITQTWVITNAGSYQVAYTASPCNSPLSATTGVQYVPAAAPTVSFVNDTLFSSETGFAVQWFINGDSIIGANNPSYVPLESGEYTVSVFNGYCTSMSPSLAVVGTHIPSSVQNFQLSPNPATHRTDLAFDLKYSQKIVLILLDNSDKTIFKETVTGQNIRKTIWLNDLPTGTYYLNIQLEQGILVRKLIKT
jgi:glucose/arabinose dehydrogenase